MLDGRYYTPEELSQRFKLSLSTIYNLIDKGELPSVKLGKCYRIPHKALATYLQSHSRGKKIQVGGSINPTIDEFAARIRESSIKKTIHSVILYGSYARGDYNSDSDIDILIILKKTDNNISDEISNISDEAMASTGYEDFLSIIQITKEQWTEAKKVKTPFYNSVTKEGIILWKKGSDS